MFVPRNEASKHFRSPMEIIRCLVSSNEGMKRVRNFRRCIRLSEYQRVSRTHAVYGKSCGSWRRESRAQASGVLWRQARTRIFSSVASTAAGESCASHPRLWLCQACNPLSCFRGFVTFRRRPTLSPELKSTSGQSRET